MNSFRSWKVFLMKMRIPIPKLFTLFTGFSFNKEPKKRRVCFSLSDNNQTIYPTSITRNGKKTDTSEECLFLFTFFANDTLQAKNKETVEEKKERKATRCFSSCISSSESPIKSDDVVIGHSQDFFQCKIRRKRMRWICFSCRITFILFTGFSFNKEMKIREEPKATDMFSSV